MSLELLNAAFGKLSTIPFGREENILKVRWLSVWLLQLAYNSPGLKHLARTREILERRAYMRATRFVTLDIPLAQYQQRHRYLEHRVTFPGLSPESVARTTVSGKTRGAKSALCVKLATNAHQPAQTPVKAEFLKHVRKNGLIIAYDANPGGRGSFPRVALPAFIERQTHHQALRHVVFQKQKGTRSSKQDAALLHDLTDCARVDHLDPTHKPGFDWTKPLPSNFFCRYSPSRREILGRDQQPTETMAVVAIKIFYGAPHPRFLLVSKSSNDSSNNNNKTSRS